MCTYVGPAALVLPVPAVPVPGLVARGDRLLQGAVLCVGVCLRVYVVKLYV